MIIEATHIHKSFGSLEVLKGIDLTVAPREIISIVGASGAGKTTLLQILGTLEAPAEGASLKICGEEVTRLSARRQAELRNRQIGFIFQAHQLLPEFTALENVMLPALIAGESRSKVRERALGLLERLGLAERASHKPAELSGGESQRVAVARALINSPAVIFADEPSGSLDTANKQSLHQLFFDLRDELGQTFVIVTHDPDFAAQATSAKPPQRCVRGRPPRAAVSAYSYSSSRSSPSRGWHSMPSPRTARPPHSLCRRPKREAPPRATLPMDSSPTAIASYVTHTMSARQQELRRVGRSSPTTSALTSTVSTH